MQRHVLAVTQGRPSRPASRPAAPQHPLLALQRQAGNRAVQRLVGDTEPAADAEPTTLGPGVIVQSNDAIGNRYYEHPATGARGRQHPDGRREATFPDGRHIVWNGGDTVEEVLTREPVPPKPKTDSELKREQMFGGPAVVDEQIAEGTTFRRYPDGTVLYIRHDGSLLYELPNGERREMKDGAETITHADGTVEVITAEEREQLVKEEQARDAWMGQRALIYASRHPKVLELQRLLNEHGAAPPVPEDKDFGPATLTAVKDFQTSRGLNADGVVGPKTWDALGGTPELPTVTEQGSGGADVG